MLKRDVAMRRKRLLFSIWFSIGAVVALLGAPSPAAAAASMNSLFSDHMVVQRDMPVPVWGTAAASEKVTVQLGAQQGMATAGADGKWLVRLPAQGAGGPFDMVVTGTSSTVTVKDVYVGEVWVASGQSNMDYRVHCTFAGCALNNEAQEVAASDYPLIRSCNVPYSPSGTPVDTVTTQWLVSSPATVANFSAAAYFFARELHKHLPNVAIGVIHGSFGASTIQCWMPREAIAAIPSVAPLLAAYEATKPPNDRNQHDPYICYNGQIHPLIPYAIRGVIWAQGESVTWGGNTYRDLQLGQIQAWRKAWGQDFTFLITQLANYNVSSSGWPILREAQLQATETLPNTGLAVTIDIGEAANVHYGDKQDLGLRLGIAARGVAYGEAIPYSGPIYDHMAIEGGAIRLFFKHAETGLAFKGNAATGFEIAGANNVFAPATARIDAANSTVVVSSAAVGAPTNVHYAWAGFPMASLYDGVMTPVPDGGTPPLPASPFRTDSVPLPPPIVGTMPDGGVLDAGPGATPDATADGTVFVQADATVDAPLLADATPTPVPGSDAPAGMGPASTPDAAFSPDGQSSAVGTTDSSVSMAGPAAAMGGNGSSGCSCRVATDRGGAPGFATFAVGLLLVRRAVRRRV